MSRIIAIIGPTASGKSSVAINVAKQLNGEIISCDSMQIYRNLNIGTAKPDEDELSTVPHHLIDIKNPEENFSVSDFCCEATKAIDNISSRGKTAVLCGGTGLYYSSLVKGIKFTGDSGQNTELRDELRHEYDVCGIDKFLLELKEADPDHYDVLETSNIKRVLRSVELLRTTGRTVAQQTEMSLLEAEPLDVHAYLLSYENRDILYNRIEMRIDSMIQNGLLKEAEYVWNNRDKFETAAAAIGYKELFPYFDGTSSLDECVKTLKTATRHYAKRQITWFKREEAELIIMDKMSADKAAEYIVRKEENNE